MNYKKIILFITFALLFFPVMNAKAFTHIDYVKDGNYAFFLFDLQAGNSTQISVTHEDGGNFTLFLFNKRPVQSYVKADKTLNNKIFSKASLVDYSIVDNPYINFTSPDDKIYYIEIILVGGGPDMYNLTIIPDDYTITRYYLPIIPGFRLEFILISIISTVGLTLFLLKKKIKGKII